MNIDPQLAVTIAAVIDEGSMEGAARVLHVTPSAVSQRVKTLEQTVGRVVLTRSRPVRVTEAGEAIVRLARQLALLDAETSRAVGLPGTAGQRIRVPIAANADSISIWLLPPLVGVAREHSLDLDLHREDQDRTASLLESGTVMAAVTSQSVPVAGCHVTPLGAMTYDVMAAPDFIAEWFPRGVTSVSLHAAPFVEFDRNDTLQHDFLRSQGVDPLGVPRHRVPASSDFAEAVTLGLGWGLVPRLQSDADRLAIIANAAVRVPLFWQQWSLRSVALDALADAVATEASRVLDVVS